MLDTTTEVSAERAPCRKLIGGSWHHEDDGEGLALDYITYDCGCRATRHVFHDGSIRIRTVRHDGKVLLDERSGDHEA